jgi:predicted ATP-grasp superfamily ATP-dependent carboligase
MAHRIYGYGHDECSMGRWVWTRFRGRHNTSLRIFSAYRPTSPQGGPFTVYAQQRQSLLLRNDNRCPRQAFSEDIHQVIQKAQEEGDKNILLLDGNKDMSSGRLSATLQSLDPSSGKNLPLYKMNLIPRLTVSGALAH